MTRQIDTHTEGIPETSSSKGSANLDCVCGIARLCVNQSNMRFWRGERSQELRVRETRSVVDACNDVRLLSAIVREYARTATTNRSPCPMLRITKMEVRARNRCGRVSAVCAARADFVGDRINPSPTTTGVYFFAYGPTSGTGCVLARLPSSAVAPREIAAVSLAFWKHVKSARSRHA